MKKRLALIITLCAASFFMLGSIFTQQASAAEQRYVGLHDRILPIADVPVIQHNTRVPLNDIAKYLYLPLEKEGNMLHIRKRGFDLTYNYSTKETRKDGILQKGNPIVESNGKLYITVTYISSELGFKTHYFPALKTLRIYRDNYPHMAHANFEHVIKNHIAKQTNAAGKATVYLTFDDGPNQFTSANMNTLKRYNLHGTFFFIGNQLSGQKQIVKAASDAGHAIGSHSMTHDAKVLYQTPDSFMNEVNTSLAIIKELSGQNSKLIRAPYGSSPYVTPAMRNALAANGYKLWDWNVDSEDWKYSVNQTGQILANVKSGVNKAYNGGNRNIVILLHDRAQTAKVLPSIIEWLRAEGYTMKRYDPNNHIMMNFQNDKRL